MIDVRMYADYIKSRKMIGISYLAVLICVELHIPNARMHFSSCIFMYVYVRCIFWELDIEKLEPRTIKRCY